MKLFFIGLCSKLRVQLGLKPLEVDEKKQKTDSEKETTEGQYVVVTIVYNIFVF